MKPFLSSIALIPCPRPRVNLIRSHFSACHPSESNLHILLSHQTEGLGGVRGIAEVFGDAHPANGRFEGGRQRAVRDDGVVGNPLVVPMAGVAGGGSVEARSLAKDLKGVKP